MVFRWIGLGSAIVALVIVPFLLFGATVEAEVARWLATDPDPLPLSLAVVVSLAADVVLPIPSSIVATAAGTVLGFPLGTLANALGLTVGALIGYWIGVAGRGLATRIVGAPQREAMHAIFARRGDVAVAVLRPIPVLAEASVIVAGIAEMPLRRFAAFATLANVGIAAAYAGLGAWASEADALPIAAAGSLLVPGLAMLVGRLVMRTPPG
ncbi:MAG: VTT domain-containing protein [Myxococcota bacterium]